MNVYKNTNIVFMYFNVLNFIYNFSFNNTNIFNSYSFHYCFFCEQDIIFCQCILFGFFCLTVQNNFVVIDLKYFYRSSSENNYNKNTINPMNKFFKFQKTFILFLLILMK